MNERNGARSQRVTIKKYANRRLYNTSTSAYVTLDHLAEMIKQGTDFAVLDARTGEDITRGLLTQIIVDEDARGHGLLSVDFLRRVICFSGDGLETLVPRYLEKAMEAFERNKDTLRKHIEDAAQGLFPFGPFDSRGGIDLKFFGALLGNRAGNAGASSVGDDQIEQLREQLSRMQRQIDSLSTRKAIDD